MMSRIYLTCTIAFLQACRVLAAQELLHNSDFESNSFTGNWQCQGNCHMTQSSDAFHGNHSVHITNRHQDWSGPVQYMNVQAEHRYKITSYIKLLGTVNNTRYQDVGMTLGCKDSDNKDTYSQFGHTPHVLPGEWYEVGGVDKIDAGYHTCKMYLTTPGPAEYLMDYASVKEVTLPSNWKTQADSDIDRLRKANIHIQLAGSATSNSNVQIELIQTEHEFVFGSAVSVDKFADSTYAAYQKAFYDNFEWGVPENALKWKQMEPTKNNINYDRPLNAIKAMRAHGKKVRGHCVFWSLDGLVQDWVKSLYGQAMLSAISTRINGVIGHTKGMLEQWDVNNENLHYDFFERHTGNPDITMEMFRQVHAVDSKPALFLNDYRVISTVESTVALKNEALRFKKRNIPIGGIGAQSHMHDIDLPSIKGRLDVLSEAGLPIMVTELGVNDANVDHRASKLSDLMYMFFSHPSVEGMMFWGFWDGQIFEKDAPLFNGPNITPNAAGLVYQNLRNKWTTNTTSTVHGFSSVAKRGFKGTYTLNVKHNGHILKTEVFTLGKGGIKLDIHLNDQTVKLCTRSRNSTCLNGTTFGYYDRKYSVTA